VPTQNSSSTNSTSKAAARLDALDGLRGVVALLVALFHVNIWHSGFENGWLRNAHPVLSCFFLISGFVITLMYGERLKDGRGVADFAVRRAGRLWSVHLFALGFLFCWELSRAIRAYVTGRTDISTFGEGWSVWELIRSVVLVHGWGFEKNAIWNFPSWTLSTEIVAYAVFATVFVSIRRLDLRVAVALVIVVVSGAVFSYGTQLQNWFGYHVAWCLQGFFLGALLSWAWQRWPIRSPLLGSAIEISCLVACVLMIPVRVTGLPSYLLWWVCVVAFVYALASGRGVVSRVLALKPITRLGELSISIYLLHFPIILILNQAFAVLERSGALANVFLPNPLRPGAFVISFGPVWLMDLLTVAYLALAVAVSALVYRFVEAPSRDFFNGLGTRIRRGEIGWPKTALRPTHGSG
jgi:peptidoglycan/LPS O-acetylase OafA/YrhL